MEEENKAI